MQALKRKGHDVMARRNDQHQRSLVSIVPRRPGRIGRRIGQYPHRRSVEHGTAGT